MVQKEQKKINAEKNHVIFNESHVEDCSSCGNAIIRTTESVRYLGAQKMTNKSYKRNSRKRQIDDLAKNAATAGDDI